jgi:hypothetical protein
MKKMPFVTAIAASAIIFSGGAVMAEEVLTFEQLDVDGNGYISAEEAQVRTELSDALKDSDADGDGQLNIAEFSAFEGKGRLTPPEDVAVPEPGAAPY